MRPDEVGVGPPEVELVLELPPLLGEGQRFSAQPPVLLAQGEVLAFHVSGVDVSLAAIGATQALSPREHFLFRAEHDAPAHLNHPASLAAFLHLGVAQEGMRNANRIRGPARLARGLGPLPDAEYLQEHVRIMTEGV
jgi:hypothetical protein